MQRFPDSGKAEFVLKLGRTPCSEMWSRIPPPENWNLGRSWHFEFWLGRTPPPPPENWNLGRSWHFDLAEPPPHWNLGRYWDFEFWLGKHPPPQILKFRQILALWVLTWQNQNPTPPLKFRQIGTLSFDLADWNLGRSWHFGFWLGRTRTPPHPQNWNLGRSWYFEFWLGRTPPLWKFR